MTCIRDKFCLLGGAGSMARIAHFILAVALTNSVWIKPAFAQGPAGPADYDHSHVGPQANGRIIVPTNQVLTPAGKQVIVGGRPTDVALSPNARWLAVLNLREVQLVNVESGDIVSSAPNKSGSFKGIAFAPDGKRLYASTVGAVIGMFSVSDAGKLSAEKPIEVQGKSRRDEGVVPVGMSISADGKTIWAVLNMKNTLAEI